MASQSPSPASTAKTITPEDLGEQATTALAESHLQLLSRYRKAYDALGSGMAKEAQALLPLVHGFRSDLELARKIWRELLEQQEIERCLASSPLAVCRQTSWPVRVVAGFAVVACDNVEPAT